MPDPKKQMRGPMLMAQGEIKLPPALEQQYRRYRIEMGEKGEEPLRADEWLKTMNHKG